MTFPLVYQPCSQTCVYDTPMALNLELGHIKGMEPKGARSRYMQNVADSRDWTVGPMPVEDFINSFLGPRDRGPMLSSRNAFASVPLHPRTPAEMYEPLVSLL